MFIKAKVKYVCKENLLIDKKVTAIKSRIPLLFGLRLGSLLKKPKIKKEMTIYTNSVWVTSWIITQKTKNKKRNDNIYKFCLGGARKKQFRNIRIQLYK